MVSRPQALGLQIAEELRLEIFSGARKPHEVLTEPKMSEHFEVSRGPIRDAFVKLEADGLIYQSGRSYCICDDLCDLVKELYDLRFLLESRAIKLMLDKQLSWDNTRNALEAFELSANDGDFERARAADFDFHQTFIEGSGGRLAKSMWSICERNYKALLSINRVEDGDIQYEVDMHRELFDAIVTGGDWETFLSQHFEIAAKRFIEKHGMASA